MRLDHSACGVDAAHLGSPADEDVTGHIDLTKCGISREPNVTVSITPVTVSTRRATS